MRVVVDASVVVKWFISEPLSDRALRLRDPSFDLCSPELLKLEVGSTLWKLARRGAIDSATLEHIARLLDRAPIRFVADASLAAAALGLARRLDHPIYDCVYLALAQAEAAPLVTDDSSLIERARAGGLERLVLPLAGL